MLADVKTVKDFTADGIIGPTDVANRVPNPCLITLQLKNGKFVRRHADRRSASSTARRAT